MTHDELKNQSGYTDASVKSAIEAAIWTTRVLIAQDIEKNCEPNNPESYHAWQYDESNWRWQTCTCAEAAAIARGQK